MQGYIFAPRSCQPERKKTKLYQDGPCRCRLATFVTVSAGTSCRTSGIKVRLNYFNLEWQVGPKVHRQPCLVGLVFDRLIDHAIADATQADSPVNPAQSTASSGKPSSVGVPTTTAYGLLCNYRSYVASDEC